MSSLDEISYLTGKIAGLEEIVFGISPKDKTDEILLAISLYKMELQDLVGKKEKRR